MKKTFLFLFLAIILPAQTGEEIIERVDHNMVVKSLSYRALMKISIGGEVREKRFFGYARGRELAYIEFIAPARDRGTRFLKIASEMWMYLPSLEKATRIAGHMLRQSMMGSDFSYDDMTENANLKDLYEIELAGIDTIDERECYKLVLTAKVPEVNYYMRILWVAKEIYVPIRVEFYSRSGKVLKELFNTDFKKINGRNYPTRVKMINRLRQNTHTELILEEIEIDIAIPEKFFSKAYLERK